MTDFEDPKSLLGLQKRGGNAVADDNPLEFDSSLGSGGDIRYSDPEAYIQASQDFLREGNEFLDLFNQALPTDERFSTPDSSNSYQPMAEVYNFLDRSTAFAVGILEQNLVRDPNYKVTASDMRDLIQGAISDPDGKGATTEHIDLSKVKERLEALGKLTDGGKEIFKLYDDLVKGLDVPNLTPEQFKQLRAEMAALVQSGTPDNSPSQIGDASVEAELRKLDAVTGQVSGEQMLAAIRDGMGDRDGKSTGPEYSMIAKWVAENPEKMSPQALAMFDMLQKEVDSAKSQGLPGIRGTDFDALTDRMETALAGMQGRVVPPVDPTPEPIPQPNPDLKPSPISERDLGRLSPEARALVDQWRKSELDPSSQAELDGLFQSGGFQGASEANKLRIVDSISAPGVGSVRASSLLEIYKGDGFANMTAREQGAVLDLVSSGNDIDWFAGISAEQQKSLASKLTSTYGTDGAALRSILESDAFATLSTEDKLTSIEAFNAAGSVEAQRNLAKLFTRMTPGNSPTAVILAKDAMGRRTIDNIADVLNADNLWTPDLTSRRAEALDNLYQVLADDGKFDQAGKGTCAATIPAKELAHLQPGEFTRLLAGGYLQGSVKLRNGDTMTFDRDSIAGDFEDRGTRGIGERLIQVAFMEYANGELDYRNGPDAHYNSRGERVHGGLWGTEQRRLMSGIYGETYRTEGALSAIYGVTYRTEGASVARGMPLIERELAAGRWAQVAMRWSDGSTTASGKHGYHAVAITEIKDGYVYFKNPWGSSDKANGTRLTNPPREIYDADAGIERMTLEEFKDRFTWVQYRR